MRHTGSPRLAGALRSTVWAAALCVATWAQASSSGVVISQVYGGGGNTGATYKNDFIELFNAGSSAVSLQGWSVQYASATGTSWQVTPLGNITLQPGQYLLVQEALGAGGTTNLPSPDASGTIALSGTAGKVALVRSATALSGTITATSANIEDFVGFGSATTYEGSAPTPGPSNTLAVARAGNGCTDTNNNGADFGTAAPQPRNTATAVVVCGASGGGSGSGGSGGSGGTGGGTGGGNITPISAIQGSGATSPLVGSTVATQGIVTRVTNNGFFMQSQVEDGNPATSDGIFVYTSTAPTVSAGQLVQVSATVAEFNVGAAGNTTTAAHTVTQLTSPTVTTLGQGYSVVPTVLTLPATEAQLEALEGMLVQVNTQLTASQNYFLGRFGQVTLSAQGRLLKPTNQFRPGTLDAVNLSIGNAQRTLLLDDGSSAQNVNPTPYLASDNTLRAGDTIDSLVGVIDYGLATSDNTGMGLYKVQPVGSVAFTRANPRPVAAPAVGGNIKVASANLLNYFTTFGDGNTASGQSKQGCAPSGTTSDCRGADSAAEFSRQRAKLIASLSTLNADVVGLMELQNNNAAIADLVAGLNAQLGTGTYAVVPDPSSGVGSDAIKVGLIYKPARVSRLGASVSDTDPSHKRPSVVQRFQALNGESFAVAVNHFKSKSCSGASGTDADQGDGQGCYNSTRLQEAQALRSYLQDLGNTWGESRFLLLGDFNAYTQEDPVHHFVSNGYADLASRFNPQAYSYVFDGEAGAIDHALASPSLIGTITGAADWHVNADEPFVIDYNLEFKQPACATCTPDYYTATPYRSSDHDPLLVGLSLVRTITGTPAAETLVGTPGDDRISGAGGADTLTGNGGSDTFVYNSLRDALDVITDFTPGDDKLDLSAVAATLRATAGASTDLIAAGYIVLADTAAGLEVRIDSDGPSGQGLPRTLVRLSGVSSATFLAARDLKQ